MKSRKIITALIMMSLLFVIMNSLISDKFMIPDIKDPKIINHEIIVDGVAVFYTTAGNPMSRTLVFLHGWPGLYLVKSGVVQELAKHFYVLAPEHPGLRRSEPLPHYENIFEQYADVVRKILVEEKRENTKPVIMGQSFGGGVASAYAYQHPSDIRTLVLVDASMGAGRDKWTNFYLYTGPTIVKLLPYMPTFIQKRLVTAVFGTPPDSPWESIKPTIPNRIAMVENFSTLIKQGIVPYIEREQRANFPTILLWGDKDGRQLSLYGSANVDYAKQLHEKMRKENRDVKLVIVNGGHTILYEKPEYVIGELLKNLLPN